jgi:uncharacterized RDD family membrane protein YckC
VEQDNTLQKRHAFDSWLIAGPADRTISFLADGVLAFCLTLATCFLLGLKSPLDLLRFWIAIFWAYELVALTFWGTTIGKKLMGVQVYSPRRDGPPDSQQVLIRILAFWIFLPLAFIGLTPILYRKDRRGWHDQVSEVLVVGVHKSLPNDAVAKLFNNVMFTQSLVVASFLIAFSISYLPIDLLKMKSEVQQVEVASCENPKIFSQNPSAALFALTLSPSWAMCWDQVRLNLSGFEDSKIFKLAEIARLVNASSTSTEVSRQLASLDSQKENELFNSELFIKHRDFVFEVLKATDKTSRLGLLKARMGQEPEGFTKQALTERIWAEELALNQVPTVSLVGASYENWWNDQACWVQAQNLIQNNECGSKKISKIVEKLSLLKNSPQESFDDILDDLSDQPGYPELNQLTEIWTANKDKDESKVKNLLASFPETSPLYHWALEFSK